MNKLDNPLIKEVRAAREALAAEFDYDLHRIFADAMARQGQKSTDRKKGSETGSTLNKKKERRAAK